MFEFVIATCTLIYIYSNFKKYEKKLRLNTCICEYLINYTFLVFFIIFYVDTMLLIHVDDLLKHPECIGIIFLYLLKISIFSYCPQKSPEIYDYIFAHRGFHLNVPENSLPSYKLMVGKFGIEMDIRLLKDGNIVCFHDRYTKRLLGGPGKTSNFTYSKLRKYTLKGTKYRVIRLKSALSTIGGKSPVLIEVKGLFTKKYYYRLNAILRQYKGDIYFHCKNIITYIKLRKVYGNKVFWILNPFRKRFNFLKGKHYSNQFEKFISFIEEAPIEIPSIEDVSQILVDAFEENNSVREIVATISSFCNNYKSRLTDKSFLLNSLILHRGIVSSKFGEHSKEAFEACVRFAKYTNTRIAIELDLIYYNGKVVCYHSDKISDKLGQAKSCAPKSSLENALTLEEILEIVKGYEDLVSIVFDIKDFNIKNRILEKEFIRIIEQKEYMGNFAVQAWNPIVLMFFEKVRPNYIRGQVGHSLSGLVKYVPINKLPWIVNVLLFNKSHADYCVYDASNFIYVLIKYNKNIKGRPVFIYAPKSEMELETFIGKEQIAGFIVENVLDSHSWSKSYIRKFKKR